MAATAVQAVDAGRDPAGWENTCTRTISPPGVRPREWCWKRYWAAYQPSAGATKRFELDRVTPHVCRAWPGGEIE